MRTIPTTIRVVLFACAAMCACSTELRGGLDEDSANQVVAALDRAGVPSRKERAQGGSEAATFNVEVSSGDVARAIVALESESLPRRSAPGIHDVFGEPSLVPTRTEEHARWSSALAGELSRSIERMAGVLDARVHLALVDAAPTLDAPPPSPRASVLVRVRADAQPPRVEDVQALVAGSVEGMATSNVAVIVERAPRSTATAAGYANIGPFAVASGSATPLRIALVGSLLVHVLCAALIVSLVRRRGERSPGDA